MNTEMTLENKKNAPVIVKLKPHEIWLREIALGNMDSFLKICNLRNLANSGDKKGKKTLEEAQSDSKHLEVPRYILSVMLTDVKEGWIDAFSASVWAKSILANEFARFTYDELTKEALELLANGAENYTFNSMIKRLDGESNA